MSTSPPPLAQLRFAERLRALRLRAGNPTMEKVAQRTGCSRSTVSVILDGKRFPTWTQAAGLIKEFGEDPALWRDEYEQAALRIDEARRSRTLPGGETALTARWYRNNPEFYSAAAEEVRRAHAQIRATYVRASPPTQYASKESSSYFAAVLAWARRAQEQGGERFVRRIVGMPEIHGSPDTQMFSWLNEHHEETADLLTYEVRVLRWPCSADWQNMALIDESIAFLAFSGGSKQRLNGFSVKDPTFLGYYADHFDQLWHALPSIDSYLRQERRQER